MEMGGGEGEDRLSALPDDVLVLILLNLDTRTAAQTRVLSHRWCHIWALLPELTFNSPPEPHRLRDVLDEHKVLLRDLRVRADGATPESLAVWLPAAARLVSGFLAIKTFGPVEDPKDSDIEEEEEEEEAPQRGAFEFPCFDKATSLIVVLAHLGYVGIAMPATGVFARLTGLRLSHVWFHGPGELGAAVSSPRCPCLQRLIVEHARGLRDLAIHSDSMMWMKLSNLHTLSQLTVMAPALEELIVDFCFTKCPPVANISAPLLTRLGWRDQYSPSSVLLGDMAHVQWLQTNFYLVYGDEEVRFQYNPCCLSLLERFKGITSLFLGLMYYEDIEDFDYLMEDMAVLPDITFLRLMVIANGHAFGVSAFHVLRLCTGIKMLRLELVIDVEACSSDCKCVQLVEWETEELLLNHLEEVEIVGWSGSEHEVAFVKRLFDWGTKLKEMQVNLCDSICDVKAKELYQTFQSFSRPGVCIKFYRHENNRQVLYAPKD